DPEVPERKHDLLTCLALASDGQTFASGGGAASIRIWRPDRDPIDAAGHSGGSLALAFTSDGRTLASGGRDRMIRLWEVASGQERRRFGGYPGWVRALAYSPDGSLLASGNTDG